MKTTNYLNMINDFEQHYQYDGTYMRELLAASTEGFKRFHNFLPLSEYREKLSLEDYWIGKLAAMQVEDCGDCLQLNVRMALEAGLAKSVLEAAIGGGEHLSDRLQDIYHYARHVASNDSVDFELLDRIASRYDKAALLELGICVATAKVFPTVKRALGYTRNCRLVEIEV